MENIKDITVAQRLKSWNSYNAMRRSLVGEINHLHDTLIFSAIPTLIHANSEQLPGFVTELGAHSGIHLSNRQSWLEDGLTYLKNQLKIEGQIEQLHTTPIIESLMIVGSIGTVAQTVNSEVDCWVIIDEKEVNGKLKQLLKTKLELIEKWSYGNGFKLHFYIIESSSIRKNDFSSINKELSSLAQSHFLKDEFYRTVLHVAGKYPLWWITPPYLNSKEYDNHKNRIFDDPLSRSDEIIDLGVPLTIPEEEYFGAILWQLNNAFTKPFKAVIKLSLLEAMKTQNSDHPLSEELKEIIISNDGKPDLYISDPYINMTAYTRDYYDSVNLLTVRKLVEKCFFIKALANFNMNQLRLLKQKHRTLEYTVKEWQVSDNLEELFEQINTNEQVNVAKLGRLIHDFMITLYERIDISLKESGWSGRQITKEDLTVIGRKLFTLYSKKATKVEFVRRVKNELEQLNEISFMYKSNSTGKVQWRAYSQNIIAKLKQGIEQKDLLLKQSSNLLSLLIWLYINRIYTDETYLYFEPTNSPLSLIDIQTLLNRISNVLPKFDLRMLEKEALLTTAKTDNMLIVVNLLSTDNLTDIETIHLGYTTSWGETFSDKLEYPTDFGRLIQLLKNGSKRFSINDPNCFDIFASKSARYKGLVNKMRGLIAEGLHDTMKK
ncbi:MAG: class I adenylate cyclase [Nitrospinota bacterium]